MLTTRSQDLPHLLGNLVAFFDAFLEVPQNLVKRLLFSKVVQHGIDLYYQVWDSSPRGIQLLCVCRRVLK